MQRDYVVKFLVEDVPRDVEEALLSDGRFAVSRRCGRTVIEGEDSAADAGAAAKAMAEHLRLGGVSVRSVMPELVTMADIHRRAGVSKQAVSKLGEQPEGQRVPGALLLHRQLAVVAVAARQRMAAGQGASTRRLGRPDGGGGGTDQRMACRIP